MGTPVAAGIIAGLITVLMLVLSARSAALAMVLSPFLTLPGFVAVLGWGERAAWIATGLAAALIGLLLGALGTLSYAAAYGLPVVVLGRLALMSRQAPAGSGASGIEWYPTGRLLAVATLLACLYSAIAVMLVAAQHQDFGAAVKAFLEANVFPQFDEATQSELDAETRTRIVATVADWLPGMLAAGWLALTLLSLYLAGRLLKRSGRLLRAWPDLALTDPPQFLPMTFAASLAGAFLLSGTAQLVAKAAAAAHMLAYLLVGLAVLHHLTRGSSMRGLLLGSAYAALFALGPVPAIAFVILGLVDAMFHLRRRQSAPPGPPAPPANPNQTNLD